MYMYNLYALNGVMLSMWFDGTINYYVSKISQKRLLCEVGQLEYTDVLINLVNWEWADCDLSPQNKLGATAGVKARKQKWMYNYVV